MDFFSFVTLFGGLAFFLYGMHIMSNGLEKMAGSKLQKALTVLTDNPFKSLLLGAGITIAIQSSSALTVMLVGLVNSGIMHFSQSIGVIMGSNIGTTLTAWILSLAGLKSDNFWLKMLKPENFSLVFALIGILLVMGAKQQKKKDTGEILIGFAVLMFGMKMMSGAVSPLADMPEFSSLLTAFKNPILGVIVGAVFTGVIQSSAASVAILQALALTGTISYEMAIPIIMGQNIGTCVTALISSIGVSRNARKVAVVHISFNLIGTLICLVGFYTADFIFDFAFADDPINSMGIAVVHSIFNVVTTLILLPFTKQLAQIANFVIKDKENVNDDKNRKLDHRLLTVPAFAVANSFTTTVNMAEVVEKSIKEALTLLDEFSDKTAKKIAEAEEQVDKFEDELSTYLVKISEEQITREDSLKINEMLHAIGDIERMGDHALNMVKVAQELHDKNIDFSPQAKEELKVVMKAIEEIVTITFEAFAESDVEKAKTVEPLEQVIDALVLQIKAQHTIRLREGNCSIELGFILSDMLTNFERISDHCSNIAISIIETKENAYGSHEYLSMMKSASNVAFTRKFNEYSKKYSIKSERVK